jgi:hypothetical protein
VAFGTPGLNEALSEFRDTTTLGNRYGSFAKWDAIGIDYNTRRRGWQALGARLPTLDRRTSRCRVSQGWSAEELVRDGIPTMAGCASQVCRFCALSDMLSEPLISTYSCVYGPMMVLEIVMYRA